MNLNSTINLILFFFITNLNAQFYNNSNNELSYQLLEKNDFNGKYRIFVVVDEQLFESDFKTLEEWDNFNQKIKEEIIDKWFYEGKRIELERYPYLSYEPIFKIKIKNPKIIQLK
jgi:hypothetical protein